MKSQHECCKLELAAGRAAEPLSAFAAMSKMQFYGESAYQIGA